MEDVVMKHLSFRIPETLRNQFKSLLAQKGISEQEVLSKFVREYVRREGDK